MKTSSAKAKGRRCAKEAKDILLISTKDILRDDDIVITSSGDTGEDLKLSPAARDMYPFSFECKNVEKLNIWKALKQAEDNSKNYVPAVIFKRNNTDLYIALKLNDFLKHYKGADDKSNKG